jgi:hypothetical protein
MAHIGALIQHDRRLGGKVCHQSKRAQHIVVAFPHRTVGSHLKDTTPVHGNECAQLIPLLDAVHSWLGGGDGRGERRAGSLLSRLHGDTYELVPSADQEEEAVAPLDAPERRTVLAQATDLLLV